MMWVLRLLMLLLVTIVMALNVVYVSGSAGRLGYKQRWWCLLICSIPTLWKHDFVLQSCDTLRVRLQGWNSPDAEIQPWLKFKIILRFSLFTWGHCSGSDDDKNSIFSSYCVIHLLYHRRVMGELKGKTKKTWIFDETPAGFSTWTQLNWIFQSRLRFHPRVSFARLQTENPCKQNQLNKRNCKGDKQYFARGWISTQLEISTASEITHVNAP